MKVKAKNFDVQPGHMLCHQYITAYENIINASSPETEVEETPMDDTDVRTLWMMQHMKGMRHQENASIQVWKRLACLQ